MNLTVEKEQETGGMIRAEWLDTHSLDWNKDIDSLRTMLGAPHNPLLFPKHFLKSTFPKIGGKVFCIKVDGKVEAAAFLFPRGDAKIKYTARLHIAEEGREHLENGAIFVTLKEAGDFAGYELYYADEPKRSYKETHQGVSDFDIGHPSAKEAVQIRELQRVAWGSEEDSLYPFDIHSEDFNLATSLVARDEGKIVGFLFGFYKLAEEDLRIESQLMTVLPEYRRSGVAFNLKKVQVAQAREEGVKIINWTVDPLQLPNAVLNFGKLRGVCSEFFPNYYEFNNALNRVPSSRLQITLPVSSDRVLDVGSLVRVKKSVVDISRLKSVAFANEGYENVNLNIKDCGFLAIEIPENWTEIQKRDVYVAEKWRESTDTILQHYLGKEGKDYAICEVGVLNKQGINHHYLLAQKMDKIQGI